MSPDILAGVVGARAGFIGSAAMCRLTYVAGHMVSKLWRIAPVLLC